jgi:hypothetical protein
VEAGWMSFCTAKKHVRSVLFSVGSEFDREDASSIAILQEIFNDSNNRRGAKNLFDLDSRKFYCSIAVH